MRLVENWAAVLVRSASLWCLYIAGLAGAVHSFILETPNGIIPDGWVATLDGWAVGAMFAFGLAAIPARLIQQASIATKPE